MASCLAGPYIVTAGSSTFSQTISIWNSQMVKQQTLTYPNNNIRSMDCSGSYMVSLDFSNYLAIDTYTTTVDITALVTLAGWVIGIIVGVVVLIVGGIIACICCCCCRRRNKGAEVMMMNNSMGQELIITSPNTGYNQPPNPQQYNQQYNAQYNMPSAEVRFQTNNLSNPQ